MFTLDYIETNFPKAALKLKEKSPLLGIDYEIQLSLLNEFLEENDVIPYLIPIQNKRKLLYVPTVFYFFDTSYFDIYEEGDFSKYSYTENYYDLLPFCDFLEIEKALEKVFEQALKIYEDNF